MIGGLLQILARETKRRDPDIVIGGRADPYLLRWFMIPRNPIFNVYLHEFRRSDDDRALHDHPWINLSYLIDGEYVEHTIAQGGGASQSTAPRRRLESAAAAQCASHRADRQALHHHLYHRAAHPAVGLPLPARLGALAEVHRRRTWRSDRQGM